MKLDSLLWSIRTPVPHQHYNNGLGPKNIKSYVPKQIKWAMNLGKQTSASCLALSCLIFSSLMACSFLLASSRAASSLILRSTIWDFCSWSLWTIDKCLSSTSALQEGKKITWHWIQQKIQKLKVLQSCTTYILWGCAIQRKAIYLQTLTSKVYEIFLFRNLKNALKCKAVNNAIGRYSSINAQSCKISIVISQIV